MAHEQLFAAVKRLRRNVSKVHCEVRGKVLAIQLHHHAERLRLHVARQQAMGYKGEERDRETERERERQRERETDRQRERERQTDLDDGERCGAEGGRELRHLLLV